ncbi:MAG: hypothetical protein JWR12_2248 [Mucilaginibacter sp.]|nr:hypothetical protein [Mucilaginibacter sp.]
MSNIFNPKRFGMLFIKHTSEHYKTYLISLGVLIGVMVLGGSFIVYLIPGGIDKNVQTLLFVPIFFLAGTIFTSTIFADFGDQKKAVATLTLPASHFEKFLVGWLYSYVIFSAVFVSSFYTILIILLNLKHIPHRHTEIFNVFAEPASSLFIVFALLQSISFFGAIFFKRFHFIKAGFCFFICVGILTLLNTSFIKALFERDVRPAIPFGNIFFYEDNRFIAVSDVHHADVFVSCLIIIVSIFFWVAAYYRLKEKQV